MGDEVRINGLTIANSVIEKVISLAAESVEGVASVGMSPGFMQNMLGKGNSEPMVAVSEDETSLILRVHVHVYYGHKLVDVSNEIRKVVADAINVQVGLDVDRVDVYVDGITFNEKA